MSEEEDGEGNHEGDKEDKGDKRGLWE